MIESRKLEVQERRNSYGVDFKDYRNITIGGYSS